MQLTSKFAIHGAAVAVATVTTFYAASEPSAHEDCLRSGLGEPLCTAPDDLGGDGGSPYPVRMPRATIVSTSWAIAPS